MWFGARGCERRERKCLFTSWGLGIVTYLLLEGGSHFAEAWDRPPPHLGASTSSWHL